MLENILQLLEIAKSQKAKGEFIDIALGKYKYPESIKEAYQQFRKEL